MLESLKKIGEEKLLSGETLPMASVNPKTNLCKIIFDLDNGTIDFDAEFELNSERAKEFLWVGNTSRGQKGELALTVSNAELLLDPAKKNKWAIKNIIDFIQDNVKEDDGILSIKTTLLEIIEKFFSDNKNVKNMFDEKIKSKNIEETIGLYTVCVKKNGRLTELVKEREYEKYLEYVLYSGPQKNGRCHVCGEDKQVLLKPSYPEGTILCMYNTDKLGFMSGIGGEHENFLRTHTVCSECKKNYYSD